MAISVLTFVNWRSTLVLMQGALTGTLSSTQSAEGYALMATLNTTGATYDSAGDDSPRNTSVFSTATCQPYMQSAVPAFAEYDRIARLIYTTFASTATLANGQAFGLYTGLTTLPPGLTGPTALVLLWNNATALWSSVLARGVTALNMPNANASPLAQILVNAYNVTIPYQTPPVDPSPPAAAASSSATVAVNTAVTNCATWLSSLTFS